MQTITEQLAKKIHDMAEKKEVVLPISEFYHQIQKLSHMKRRTHNIVTSPEPYEYPNKDIIREYYQVYNAFTTDELLEMLPAYIKKGGYSCKLTVTKKGDKEYDADYIFKQRINLLRYYKPQITPSQALGELYLYCLANDLIT